MLEIVSTLGPLSKDFPALKSVITSSIKKNLFLQEAKIMQEFNHMYLKKKEFGLNNLTAEGNFDGKQDN